MPPAAKEGKFPNIAQRHENLSNFPNYLNSIDGKYILISCPMNSFAEFFNHQGTFSVELLAVVDANYFSDLSISVTRV